MLKVTVFTAWCVTVLITTCTARRHFACSTIYIQGVRFDKHVAIVQQFHVVRFDSIGKEYVWSIERTHNVIMMKRKEEAKTDSVLTPRATGAKLPITFAAYFH